MGLAVGEQKLPSATSCDGRNYVLFQQSKRLRLTIQIYGTKGGEGVVSIIIGVPGPLWNRDYNYKFQHSVYKQMHIRGRTVPLADMHNVLICTLRHGALVEQQLGHLLVAFD